MKFVVSIYLTCMASWIVTVTVMMEQPWWLMLLGRNEYYVRVMNGFTNNSSVPLVIWCASEEMDLGGRALQKDDDFSWVMRPNFWATNTMKCTIKWDTTRKTFEAFNLSRDTRRCRPHRICSWLVTQHGFYFSNDEVNWRKDFQW
ncbi:hypothetical protein Fmac_009478 [Flemingia macrophylla]|uniref:S-protein homolog n=1 Tax=Flemingia macrophylla TaxID=520843 RepID=A0ABD1N1M1_9FABA